ncbi:universal stress protein [Streptomyces mashuensis]|nr:universal stress protein [Streptomyces mashuensis]
MDPPAAPLTAGLDGSPASLAAAHWAAAEARRRGLGLRLLHAWVLHVPAPAGTPPEKDRDHWARRILDAARTEVLDRFPGLEVTGDLVAEEPADALLAAAGRSTALVLGSRGLDRLQSFFLGDTGLHVAGRGECPVVLVRSDTPSDDRTGGGCVVAGISLDRPCPGLLDFAFATAAARGVPLRLVHGSPLPVQAYAPWGVDPDIAREIADDADRELTELLRRRRQLHPGVDVAHVVRPESPAKAVVHAAEDAALVVVGRRRHRPALVPRLGAVAQACIHHAPCPVAVVPHD